ncbi:MAG: helix-turn-helix domain-containing protein [Acidobacteriota bacterium]
MDDEGILEQGQRLSEELARERQGVEGRRWRCAVDLRARIVAHAVGCSADGESHQRIADRLGMTQRTLTRWIRAWRQAGAGVRQVAIVPASRRRAIPAADRVSLRLRTPRGFVVEGLDAELLVSLLQVLG